jgi:dephospho-CoA kinase
MRRVFAADPHAIAMIESALIFEASQSGSVPGWRDRFDQVILVTAPDELKIRRFVERAQASGGGDAETLAAEARRRLAAQIPDAEKISRCDWVIDNSETTEATRSVVQTVYAELRNAAKGVKSR